MQVKYWISSFKVLTGHPVSDALGTLPNRPQTAQHPTMLVTTVIALQPLRHLKPVVWASPRSTAPRQKQGHALENPRWRAPADSSWELGRSEYGHKELLNMVAQAFEGCRVSTPSRSKSGGQGSPPQNALQLPPLDPHGGPRRNPCQGPSPRSLSLTLSLSLSLSLSCVISRR